MLLLFQLGQLLEPAIGRIRFALLYFAALLAGSAGALIIAAERLPRGGVRGGVRADGRGVRRSSPPRRQPAVDRSGYRPLLNLMFTFTIPGISIGGHIGGIIGGAVAGWVVLAPTYKGVPQLGDVRGPGRGDGDLSDRLGRHRRVAVLTTAGITQRSQDSSEP